MVKKIFSGHFFITVGSPQLELCKAYFTGTVGLTVWSLHANGFQTQRLFSVVVFFIGMLKCNEMQKGVDRSKIHDFQRFL